MTQDQPQPTSIKPVRKAEPLGTPKARFRTFLLLAFVALVIVLEMWHRSALASHVVFVLTDIGHVKIRALGKDGMVTTVQVAGSSSDLEDLVSVSTMTGSSLHVAEAENQEKTVTTPATGENVVSITHTNTGTIVILSTNQHTSLPNLLSVHALKIKDADITLPLSQEAYEKIMGTITASSVQPGQAAGPELAPAPAPAPSSGVVPTPAPAPAPAPPDHAAAQ